MLLLFSCSVGTLCRFAINYDVTANRQAGRQGALARLALASPQQRRAGVLARGVGFLFSPVPGKQTPKSKYRTPVWNSGYVGSLVLEAQAYVGEGLGFCMLRSRDRIGMTLQWGGSYSRLLAISSSSQSSTTLRHGPRRHLLQLSVGPGFLSRLRLGPASARGSGCGRLYPLWFLHQCAR